MGYAHATTKRFELYALTATTPLVGMATGAIQADIIHYGGNTIEVTRTLRSVLTSSSYQTNIYTGMRSMYGADLNTITGSSAGSIQFDNKQRHQFYPGGGPKDLDRYERLARLGNGEGQSNVRFAADGLNFATRLSESQMISAALNAFDATQGIIEATARYLAFGGTYILSYGSWLVGNGTDEVRGYAGFQISNGDAVGYGWIASDVNPHGVVGEAHLATTEKGAATAAKMVKDMISFVRKIEATPLDGFEPTQTPYASSF